MSRILVTGLLCLTFVSAVDATPRERRARRRAGRTPATQQTRPNYSYNYGPTQAAPQASSPPVYLQPMSTHVAPSVANYSPVEQIVSPNVATETVQATPTVVAYNTVSPIGTVVESEGGVAQATAVQPAAAVQAVPDLLPTVASSESLTTPEPFCASCSVIPAGRSFNSALTELNTIRARRGLRALIEDPSLSAIAHQKASIQANRGAMYHPGGTMGGARYEGVGMGPQFTTCYQDATNVTYAGAATVTGRNGQRYHCLLVK